MRQIKENLRKNLAVDLANMVYFIILIIDAATSKVGT